MGYYLVEGILLVSTAVFIFFFGMRKFPKRNLYFAYSFVYIYINFIILAILSYLVSMHQPHVSLSDSEPLDQHSPSHFGSDAQRTGRL